MELEAQAAEHKRLEETLPQQERMWEQRRNAQQALEQEVLRLHLAAQQLNGTVPPWRKRWNLTVRREAQQYRQRGFGRKRNDLPAGKTRQAWEACRRELEEHETRARTLKHSCGKPRRPERKALEAEQAALQARQRSCGRSGSIRRHASWLIALCGCAGWPDWRAGQSGAGVELGEGLSDTANGTLSGKEKDHAGNLCSRPVLTRVLRRSNLRLMVMSGGQYELKRRRTADNQRSQSGLELDVIDHYNGSERSVKTLFRAENL